MNESRLGRLTPLQLSLVLITVAAVLALPAPDIYEHIHTAWLYNSMMKSHVFLASDPYILSGHQSTYGKGFFSYVLAGLGWFIFNKSVIKLLEIAFFIGLVWLSLRLFKNRSVLMVWYALLYAKIIVYDMYAYLASVFFFYLGIYLIKKHSKKPFGDIAVLIAGLNHPFVAASNMVLVFFRRKLLFIGSLIVLTAQIILIRYVFVSSNVVVPGLFNLTDWVWRTAAALFPLYMETIPTAVRLIPKFFFRIANVKTAYLILVAGIAISYPATAFHNFKISYQDAWTDSLSCYYKDNYADIPSLNGNVRTISDCGMWIYAFPLRRIVSSLSSETPNKYFPVKWDEEDYLSYLKSSNTSYVIFCKKCSPLTLSGEDTGELQILKSRFPVYSEVNDYTIFDVRNSSGKFGAANAVVVR